jgi:hypothetical protein
MLLNRPFIHEVSEAKMKLHIPALAGLLVGVFSVGIVGQQTPQKTKGNTEEIEQRRKERVAQVRSLLISLASDAASFRDQALRARSLARVANALWKVDPEQGRRIFRSAWEAAETADQADTPYDLGQQPPNLRREVINMVARRDRQLGEEFLRKLDVESTEQQGKNGRTTANHSRDELRERMALAMSLLNSGDKERALQFADPVLSAVSIATVDFLTTLRNADSAGADARYLNLLRLTRSNPSADGNTISLLSSYLFSPSVYITFNTEGAAGSSVSSSTSSLPNVSGQVRQAFFVAAAEVLTRQQPPPEQDQRTSGVRGEYMVVKRLLPLFERYASADLTSLMLGQLEALSSAVDAELRQAESEWVQKGLAPESVAEQERSLQAKLDRAKTASERDEILFQLALAALRNNDQRARDYVSRIDESTFREQAQTWIDANLAMGAIKNKDAETALDLIHKSELPHLLRVWVFCRAADILAKSDHDRAVLLLNEAAREADRIDKSDLNRPRALLAIANVILRVDPARTWEAAFDAIKAANSTSGFTGEGGVISLNLNNRSQIRNKTVSVPDFDIEGLFATIAKSDFERALQLARGFQAEAPRAVATIAISQAVLNESVKDASQSLLR